MRQDAALRPAPRAASPARGLLLLSLLLATGAACRPEPIKLGGVFGLSGRHYDLGVSGRNGASLAVEEVNAAGGVQGRRLELLVRDDEQDEAVARRAVEGLVRDGVVAIVGHMTSAMTEATLPIANRERVLLVSPTTSAAKFLGLDDWLVMLYPSTRQSVEIVLDRMARVEKARRVAVFHDLSNRAFTLSWLDQLRQGLEARGGEVVPAPFTSGQVESFAGLVDRALAARPEALVVVANALDSAAICQQARKRDAAIPIYGSDWGFTQDVVAHGGKAVEGAVFTLKVSMDDQTPAFVRFKEVYSARFARAPDFAALLAYEAVQVVAEGLRRERTRDGLRRAILAIGTFHGLQGDFTIDRNGDVSRPQLLMTIRDGKIVPIR
jgi:branched-chain amino acid transport system substrate-binding protein